MEREEYIMRFDVSIHDGVKVGGASYFLDYNPVPFKGCVSFVGQQPELVCAWGPFHGKHMATFLWFQKDTWLGKVISPRCSSPVNPVFN